MFSAIGVGSAWMKMGGPIRMMRGSVFALHPILREVAVSPGGEDGREECGTIRTAPNARVSVLPLAIGSVILTPCRQRLEMNPFFQD